MPHAGEIAPGDLASGPRSVAFCVDVLGAARVGHGVLAAPDAPLVARMATSGVCLDVCPTSNFLLSVWDVFALLVEYHTADNDFDKAGGAGGGVGLLAQGVTCTINADDPLLFGCSLLSEFEVCRHTLGMDDETLGACARASFQHARCSDAVRNAGIAGVDAWLALDA
ncbi:hypothetical protein T484DRAFT_1834097 [Baffinella frigidus]|nr:hypothetical protein T484DRAFT_1834097 [Cryptophyta sp. CCMP2293]